MPEGIEAEIYRRAAEAMVGRRINSVWVDDRCGDPHEIAHMAGAMTVAARRHGKLMIIDTDRVSMGVHFAMTGRLIVDGDAPIEALAYGARRDDPAWDRLRVCFDDGGWIRVNDPRRWSRYWLDPSTATLGVDLFAEGDELNCALSAVGPRRGVKAALLDQRIIAGIGNLIADEVASTAGVLPASPLGDIGPARLAAAIAATVRTLHDRGGSHTGVLGPDVRFAGGTCPRDGAELCHGTVAGRSTYWCPVHQTG